VEGRVDAGSERSRLLPAHAIAARIEAV
jgi:hypothetical protein